MPKPIRFGVMLLQIKRTWPEARRGRGVRSPRLRFRVGLRPRLRRADPAPADPEAWSELAAVAAITERVELGTLVTPPFFRNPAVFAKQVATVDHVSNGRTR